MSRSLLAAAVAATLLLVAAFVPVGGRTVVERWNAAPSATAFAERGWREVVASWDRLWGAEKPARPAKAAPARTASARPQREATAARPAPEPAEHHTEADRSALDRIVAEHAGDRPAPRR